MQDIDRINQLLKTGTTANMKLAFELANAAGIDLNHAAFQSLYKWCITHQLLKPKKRLATQYKDLIQLQDLRLVNLATLEWPVTMEWLVNVSSIYLHQCGTHFLPDFSSLGAVKEFRSHLVPLKQVSAHQLPKNLEYLSLSYAQLSNFPTSTGSLKQLKTLLLAGNPIKTLPDDLSQLTALEELSLNHNRLSSLAGDWTGLKQLKKLHLYNNELKTLPDSFIHLINLEELNMAANPLKALPECLLELPKLKWVSFGKDHQIPTATVAALQERIATVNIV